MGENEQFWVEEHTGHQNFSIGMKRKARTKKLEFIGWGSRPLIEFLESTGIDASKQISQYDVAGIINKYVNDHNLNHPAKKKRIVCDERLLSLFGRKTIARIKIYDMLGTHFAENQVESDDELLFSSEEEDGAKEQQKHLTSDKRTPSKKKVSEAPKSCFAAIIPANIKLVYLKRSLVLDLLKEPETFEGKIVGSFVRIKSDPNDYLQKNSHMLVQVTGLKRASRSDEKSADVVLQVSNFVKDVCISMLSDDNFHEEECEDLHQRIRDGLLRQPTIVELEEKVQVLHQDVTNHWLVRELALLQKLIDRANEKGWRKELFEYLDRRQLLQTPDEKSRLLREVPKVIAEEIEAEVTPEDIPDDAENGNHGSPESTLNGGSKIIVRDVAAKELPSAWISFSVDSTGNQATFATTKQNNGTDYWLDAQEKQPNEVFCDSNSKMQPMNAQEHSQDCRLNAQQKQPTDISCDSNCKLQPVNAQEHSRDCQLDAPQKQPTEISCGSNDKTQPMNTQQHSRGGINVQVIDLSDDDDDDENEDSNVSEALHYDLASYVWYYTDPQGEVQGPFSINSLKRWNDADYFPPGFKIWMMGQSPREAVLLSDILPRTSRVN
ncbi:hypothetical protein JCGZ_11863 [Jatropha curcas]|uniref:Uncharacterized protein n=1 Tax=Jatropha curcas TaxID=180498 RepID=A0A067LMD0_JATCU|nr:uncharacterized protein At5g08430 [Jatropha curcas]KDP45960.1 hypothetical protein JCGZ_11863 [Jatropha curcas]